MRCMWLRAAQDESGRHYRQRVKRISERRESDGAAQLTILQLLLKGTESGTIRHRESLSRKKLSSPRRDAAQIRYFDFLYSR